MPAINNFPKIGVKRYDPGTTFLDLTSQKHDTNELAVATRAIFIATDGTVKFTDIDGNTSALTVYAGWQINVGIKQLWSTGTTATVFGVW